MNTPYCEGKVLIRQSWPSSRGLVYRARAAWCFRRPLILVTYEGN